MDTTCFCFLRIGDKLIPVLRYHFLQKVGQRPKKYKKVLNEAKIIVG